MSLAEVFDAVVPISAGYIGENISFWNSPNLKVPVDLAEFDRLFGDSPYVISAAAVAAPNPDKPPFYLDMPFEEVDGQIQAVEAVQEKIYGIFPVNDVEGYLDKSEKLGGILIYHGGNDTIYPIEGAREFDAYLSELDIEHEILEIEKKPHCDLDYEPVIQFLTEHLAFE